MQIRTNCPYNNNYYIRLANNGWNGAVQGKPTKAGANVLANCVGYANGRFAEIQGLGMIKYQLVCNAENFIEKAKNFGLKVVSYPTLGGIMVWQKGNSLSGGDGAGHVAIVERIDSKNQIYTSESCYGGTAFYNSTRTNSNGRWGAGSAYKFRGCIINPAIGDVHYEEPKKEEEFEVAKVYKNGSKPEIVYADTNLTKQVGSLDKYEQCECLAIVNGRYLVKYKVNGTNNYKCGFCKYSGGVK